MVLKGQPFSITGPSLLLIDCRTNILFDREGEAKLQEAAQVKIHVVNQTVTGVTDERPQAMLSSIMSKMQWNAVNPCGQYNLHRPSAHTGGRSFSSRTRPRPYSRKNRELVQIASNL